MLCIKWIIQHYPLFLNKYQWIIFFIKSLKFQSFGSISPIYYPLTQRYVYKCITLCINQNLNYIFWTYAHFHKWIIFLSCACNFSPYFDLFLDLFFSKFNLKKSDVFVFLWLKHTFFSKKQKNSVVLFFWIFLFLIYIGENYRWDVNKSFFKMIFILGKLVTVYVLPLYFWNLLYPHFFYSRTCLF